MPCPTMPTRLAADSAGDGRCRGRGRAAEPGRVARRPPWQRSQRSSTRARAPRCCPRCGAATWSARCRSGWLRPTPITTGWRRCAPPRTASSTCSCCSVPTRSTTVPTPTSPAVRIAGARRIISIDTLPSESHEARRRGARCCCVRREGRHHHQPRGPRHDAGRARSPPPEPPSRLDDRRRTRSLIGDRLFGEDHPLRGCDRRRGHLGDRRPGPRLRRCHPEALAADRNGVLADVPRGARSAVARRAGREQLRLSSRRESQVVRPGRRNARCHGRSPSSRPVPALHVHPLDVDALGVADGDDVN